MENVSTARIALKWGLIFGIFSILFTSFLYNSDWWQNWIVTLVVTTISAFLIVYFSLKEFKDLSSGFMSFSDGLGLGTLTLGTGMIIGNVYDFCYKKFVDPNIIKLQMNMARQQYEKIGMSETQIAEALNKAEGFATSGLAFLIAIITSIFMGFIVSLIMSGIMQKRKPLF